MIPLRSFFEVVNKSIQEGILSKMDDFERMREVLGEISSPKITNKKQYGKRPIRLKNWMEMMGCFGNMFFGGKGKLN